MIPSIDIVIRLIIPLVLLKRFTVIIWIDFQRGWLIAIEVEWYRLMIHAASPFLFLLTRLAASKPDR